MLKVAAAFEVEAARSKDGAGGDLSLLLDAQDVELLGGAEGEEEGMTSAEHSREVTADFAGEDYEAEKREDELLVKSFVATTAYVEDEEHEEVVYGEEDELEDDDDDSDYRPEEEDDDDEPSESESEDDECFRRSVERELDDHADDVGDFYVQRMAETAAPEDAEDAAWVARFLRKQHEWKETHGASIDEMDVDLRVAERQYQRRRRRRVRHGRTDKLDVATDDDRECLAVGGAIAEAWNGRVSPYLPAPLRRQPAELLLSAVGVALFIAVALAVQFYVAFKPPLYS